jgi:cytochrome c-type biogenesis protein CcmH/NrfG
LGDYYARERNYEHAREAYTRALNYAPDNEAIQERMAQIEEHLTEEKAR